MSSEPRSWNGTVTKGRPTFTDPDKTFDNIQEILGRKWHLRIVYQLLDKGPMGFSDLKSELVGVSSKMLSESLSTLEDERIVDRTIVSEQPVRVEYSLTDRGAALEPVVSSIVTWGSEYELEGDE